MISSNQHLKSRVIYLPPVKLDATLDIGWTVEIDIELQC